jgi:hypothetical protein
MGESAYRGMGSEGEEMKEIVVQIPEEEDADEGSPFPDAPPEGEFRHL